MGLPVCRPFVSALLLAASAAGAPAQTPGAPSSPAPDLINADRPGLADTGTVIGTGWFQVESGLQGESRTGEQSFFVPALLRLGLTDRFEVRIEGNTLTSVRAAGTRQSGLAPVSLGGKYVVRSGDAGGPGLGVIGRVFPASGSGRFESNRATGDVRLASDWDFAEHLSLNPNVGLGWYESDEGVFVAGLMALTLTYAPRPSIAWFVDTGIQSPEAAGGRVSVIVDGGVAYIPRPNLQLDVSAGTRAHGATPPRPFISVGVAFRTRAWGK